MSYKRRWWWKRISLDLCISKFLFISEGEDELNSGPEVENGDDYEDYDSSDEE